MEGYWTQHFSVGLHISLNLKKKLSVDFLNPFPHLPNDVQGNEGWCSLQILTFLSIPSKCFWELTTPTPAVFFDKHYFFVQIRAFHAIPSKNHFWISSLTFTGGGGLLKMTLLCGPWLFLKFHQNIFYKVTLPSPSHHVQVYERWLIYVDLDISFNS